jgi:hypothetical protein
LLGWTGIHGRYADPDGARRSQPRGLSQGSDANKRLAMETDLGRVIVTTGATAHTTSVHHHGFPEIRAEGETAGVAASHLLNQLTCALDSALTLWRREAVEHAIADVRAFIAKDS